MAFMKINHISTLVYDFGDNNDMVVVGFHEIGSRWIQQNKAALTHALRQMVGQLERRPLSTAEADDFMAFIVDNFISQADVDEDKLFNLSDEETGISEDDIEKFAEPYFFGGRRESIRHYIETIGLSNLWDSWKEKQSEPGARKYEPEDILTMVSTMIRKLEASQRPNRSAVAADIMKLIKILES